MHGFRSSNLSVCSADETRLRLLLLLEQAELTVAEIQEILSMGQSRISTHLAQLKRAGLVSDRRAGKHIYYGLAPADDPADASRARLREIVAASAKEIPESATDRTALGLVLRKREDRAREYFNRLAGKFGRSYCPGRSLAGHGAHAPGAAAADGHRRSRRGRGHALATARAHGQAGHRGG